MLICGEHQRCGETHLRVRDDRALLLRGFRHDRVAVTEVHHAYAPARQRTQLPTPTYDVMSSIFLPSSVYT